MSVTRALRGVSSNCFQLPDIERPGIGRCLKTYMSDTPPRSSSFQFQIPTDPGRVYLLEYTPGLSPAAWLPLPLRAGALGPQLFKDPTATNAERYYRLRRW
jgi:hypothetical protein